MSAPVGARIIQQAWEAHAYAVVMYGAHDFRARWYADNLRVTVAHYEALNRELAA